MPADLTKAMVLGGADCVWDDVLALEDLCGKQWDGFVVAANDVGCHWPRHLDHMVSLHPRKFEKWRQERADYGGNIDYVTWGRMKHLSDRHFLDVWPGGSSGMLAAQVARLGLRCSHVVLCGVPMTKTPHFEESSEHGTVAWSAEKSHWRAWIQYQDELQGWLKSMSGRTRELLGAPTVEWLQTGDPDG